MKLTPAQEVRLARAAAALSAVSQLAGTGRNDEPEVTIRRDDLACLLDLIADELGAALEL